MKLDKTLVFLIIMHIALVAKVAKRKKNRKDEFHQTLETYSEARKHFFALANDLPVRAFIIAWPLM